MCPCCSTTLLRYARHDGLYLFCPHCWAEMPDLDQLYHDGQDPEPQAIQYLEAIGPHPAQPDRAAFRVRTIADDRQSIGA
jgi:Zn-finger nucleic acid-binding protein